MAAAQVFRETFVNSDPLKVSLDDWNSAAARSMRYRLYWAMFENTAYRKVNSWAKQYLTEYGMYRFTRPIYNPAYRLGDWWQSHLWGGTLDPLAGDGKAVSSAIPITTKDESLRKAISQLWTWSNWQIQKGIVTLHGPVLGDAVIKIIDDVDRKRVYMLPIHPGTLYDVKTDEWGNVKGYEIREERQDPDTGLKAIYREVCTRDGDKVAYTTYKNEAIFDWDGDGKPTWKESYGFVPMVVIPHRNVGMKFGWSEMHPAMPDFREVDDLSSLLHDQIRKTVNVGWLYSGVNPPSKNTGPGKTDDLAAIQAGNPEGDRQNTPAHYGPVGATATPLVAPLQIADVLAGIEKIVAKIERDFPELSEDIDNASGDVSGRALRINRQPVITKVKERRPNYDNALVRAQQMAVAIGGYRKYDGFSGYDLDSFAAGKLDHTIDPNRPVYEKDPLDDLEVETELWTSAKAAKDAGIPLLIFLKRNGWSEQQISDLQADPDYQTAQEQKQFALQASRALAESPTPPGVTNKNQPVNTGKQGNITAAK